MIIKKLKMSQLSAVNRRSKRLERKLLKAKAESTFTDGSDGAQPRNASNTDERFAKLLAKDEDELLNFVANINKVCIK